MLAWCSQDAFKQHASIDVERSVLFDVEVLPRVNSVLPTRGSLAGGAELTVTGTGFGSNPDALMVSVGDVPCTVLELLTGGLRCRVQPREAARLPRGPFPGERGARWQWTNPNPSSPAPLELGLLAAASTPTGAVVPAGPERLVLLRAQMSSTYDNHYRAAICIDGVTSTGFCHTQTSYSPWLSIEIAAGHQITKARIFNRLSNQDRLDPFELWVGESAGHTGDGATLCGGTPDGGSTPPTYDVYCPSANGTFVTVLTPGPNRVLNLAEMQVWGFLYVPPKPATDDWGARTGTLMSTWFEAPCTCDVSFVLRLDGPAQLRWGGAGWLPHEHELLAEVRAEVPRLSSATTLSGVTTTTPWEVQQKPILLEVWRGVNMAETGDYASLGMPTLTTRLNRLRVSFASEVAGFSTVDEMVLARIFDRFVARFTFRFEAPSTGECAFHCTGDDRCTVFIDGALVLKTSTNYETVQNASVAPAVHNEAMLCASVWHNSSGVTSDSESPPSHYLLFDCPRTTFRPCMNLRAASQGSRGKVSLVIGRWYAVEVQYTERTGNNRVTLYWQPAGSSSSRVMAPEADAWPRGPTLSGHGEAISRKVAVVEGNRYFLSLNCSSSVPCGVGALVHTDRIPLPLRLESRQLQSRVKSQGQCNAISDRAQCCATLDEDDRPCVPATSQFGNNVFCEHYAHAVQHFPGRLAACPASRTRTGSTVTSSKVPAAGRDVLPAHVGCDSLRDRGRCCSSIDGRTQAYHAGQPCIPAAATFQNGDVCRPAREVHLYEPAAAASCSEFGVDGGLAYGGVVHAEQTITLGQSSPRLLTQVVTLRAITCPPGTDCMTR